MKRYPAIEFAAKYGRGIALIVAAVLAVGGLAYWAVADCYAAALVGIVAAAAIWTLLRVAAELIEVIADTLLPK